MAGASFRSLPLRCCPRIILIGARAAVPKSRGMQESVALSQRPRLPISNISCNFKHPFCSLPIPRLVLTPKDYFRQIYHNQLYATGRLQNPLGTHSELFNFRTTGLAHLEHMNNSLQCNVIQIIGAWICRPVKSRAINSLRIKALLV
jgi:hypothetical protein